MGLGHICCKEVPKFLKGVHFLLPFSSYILEKVVQQLIIWPLCEKNESPIFELWSMLCWVQKASLCHTYFWCAGGHVDMQYAYPVQFQSNWIKKVTLSCCKSIIIEQRIWIEFDILAPNYDTKTTDYLQRKTLLLPKNLAFDEIFGQRM